MKIIRSPLEQAAYLEIRKKEVGLVDADFERARNSGYRRTPEKRRLLALIDRLTAETGKPPLFTSNY